MKAAAEISVVASLGKSFPAKSELERWVAQIALGLVAALRTAEIPIESAQRELSNPAAYQEARRRRLAAPVLELLTWGMELSDVAELAPHALAESYGKIAVLASGVLKKHARLKSA